MAKSTLESRMAACLEAAGMPQAAAVFVEMVDSLLGFLLFGAANAGDVRDPDPLWPLALPGARARLRRMFRP